MIQKFSAIFSAILLFLCVQNLTARAFPPIKGANGMVVTADRHATQTGLRMLQSGGNAVDAAVSIAFTLAVTYPQAGNIGGGGFMLIRTADNTVRALDYRETAPAKATQNMYLDSAGNVIEKASTVGYLAVGVPGTVRGLWQAHKKFGSKTWRSLLQPAIRYAEQGFILDEYTARLFNYYKKNFSKFSSAKSIFVKENTPFKAGDRFFQPDLAATLQRIADHGPDGFYSGKTARLIVADMQAHGGLISEKDLQSYRAVWRQPIHFTYHGYAVFSMPPPSSGGILLAEILNTLEPFPLRSLGHNSSDMMRLWAETERQAYADRAQWLGDPGFVHNPVSVLTSKAYADSIRTRLNYFYARSSASIHPGLNMIHEKEQTTHFSVVDRMGNAVSNTYTLNGSFGSFAVVAGAGFLLNNEMDDFSVKPGHYNSYGLLGSDANAVAPGKRMLSSMSPTIVTRNDSLFMVVGAPGGSKIITAVAQVISNVIDHGMNIRQAIEAPRFHHQWKPDTLFVEKNRFCRDAFNSLIGRGYRILEINYVGYAQGIVVNKDNTLSGWSDPRSNGAAAGY